MTIEVNEERRKEIREGLKNLVMQDIENKYVRKAMWLYVFEDEPYPTKKGWNKRNKK